MNYQQNSAQSIDCKCRIIMKRRTLIILLLASTVAFVWSCRPREIPRPTATIRIAYRPLALADITPIILQEAGLKTQGLNVELVAVPSPQVALQRFDAGEVDAIAGLTMEAILQRIVEQGDPGFRAFYFQVDEAGKGWVSLVANKHLGKTDIKGLARKPVASLPTAQARFLVRQILLSAGIPPADIQVVDYNPATPLLGLESGEQAALFGLEPAISRATAQGHTIIAEGPVSEYLFNGKPVPLSASVIRTSLITQHGSDYKTFLDLYRRAVEYQTTNENAVREYFGKTEYGGLDETVRQNLALPTLLEPNSPGVLQALRDFVGMLQDASVLKANINVGILVQ